MTHLKTAWMVLVALLALTAQAHATPLNSKQNAANVCVWEAAKAEAAYGIPFRLLGAISVVETGRWDEASRASFAWPWSVTSGSEGKYFPTKAAAIRYVRKLQARGVTNIDVGCMQINLRYHPEAFADLNQAFEPRANVTYAASYLKKLFRDTRAWHTAMAHYHSTTPKHGKRYREKVLESWQALKEGRYADHPEVIQVATSENGVRNQSYNSSIMGSSALAFARPLPDTQSPPAYRPVTTSSTGGAAARTPTDLEKDRAKAKAFATNWRAQKLAEWRASKQQSEVE